MKLYLIGSLRNDKVPVTAEFIRRKCAVTVFDDWYAAGPEADDYWQKYEKSRGHTYEQALKGNAARHVYEYDKSHLDSSDMAVLMLPAGKSGHLEFGYMIGKGKKGIIYIPEDEPERWDVMYLFADRVVHTKEKLVEAIEELSKQVLQIERFKNSITQTYSVWEKECSSNKP